MVEVYTYGTGATDENGTIEDNGTIVHNGTIVPAIGLKAYANLSAKDLPRALASGSFPVGDRMIECAVRGT